MKKHFPIGLSAVVCCMLMACNQPFEPDGPVNSKLVLYSILNSASTTQYVRVSTTYEAPPGPEIRDASVRMLYDGKTIEFHDTTIASTDGEGRITPLNIYVAYNQPVHPGSRYLLQVATPSGLAATASTTALGLPTFTLSNPRILDHTDAARITLNTSFGTFTGAFVMHFYLDFYAYVEGGWELHRAEVPLSSRYDTDGDLLKTYPSLALVQALAASQKIVQIHFDAIQYTQTRAETIVKYPAAPIVWLRAAFILTQIDDVLYQYYYVNNGPIDESSIRLDQPDFTNIPDGLGVFGNSVTVTVTYPITQ